MNRLSSGNWEPTGDLEMCDERGAHLLEWVPPDDGNPRCLVGGGELNLRAGIELWKQYQPNVVLCAFGHRSAYLEEVGAPSESYIMSERFLEEIPGAEMVVWDKFRPGCRPTNTQQELINAFDFALKFGPSASVGIVTVGVHVARTMLFVVRHQQQFYRFANLRVRGFESEEVLLAADETLHRPRIKALRGSRAFVRSLGREANGVSDLLLGRYQAVSSC